MAARRVLLVAIFLLIAISVLLGGHFYIASRLVLEPELSGSARVLLLLLIACLAASIVGQGFARRALRTRWWTALAWTSSVWMGLAFLLIALLAASDALLWLLGGTALADPGESGGAAGAAGARALSVSLLALCAAAAGLSSAMRDPTIVHRVIRLSSWPHELDGFRIVQISDVHLGPLLRRSFAERVVELANALEPDLIALTGDLADGDPEQLRHDVAPFGRLRARHGAFFVTGNHDHYSGVKGWVEAVEALGLRVLRNQRVTIDDGTAAFDLAGVDDHRGGWSDTTEDLPAALAGRTPGRALVLLAHDPATFPAAAEAGVELQLSGHTHGGQIWPFRYLVRLATPYVAGLYRKGASQLYVSRGTGFWGPPMRLFSPAEITEISLIRA